MTAEPVWSVDPRTGKPREQVAVEATAEDVDRAVRAAHAARGALADRTARAALLRTAAELLDEAQARVVETADAETALGPARLTGELARTTAQLRYFADIVDEGAFLDVRISLPDPDTTPPTPDLRRMKIPLGVVAVYAASNFPLAFSVPGGDTASALAAGCPVVIKAHPYHPATSELCAALLRRAAVKAGLPEDVVVLVHGFDAGVELIRHPLVAAAGFTGSVNGGRALFDAAAARPVPIPFHGELGSLNPVVVTEAAAEERAEELAAGLAGSMTLGQGQFCTKPGFVLAPAGAAGERFTAALTAALKDAEPGVMLAPRMRGHFLTATYEDAQEDGIEAPVQPGPGGPHTVVPGYLLTDAATLLQGGRQVLLRETFGPVTLVARYASREEISAVLALVPGNLTATLHTADEDPEAASLLAELAPLAGRLLVNGWPTGVAVADAQHHGGPYPATTTPFTSVGGTAIERWLRPITYQSTPQHLLPPELRDDNPLGIPRF
ncbi:aldehyde dehydrogenase family protein [Streptomyces sp. NPDC126499]|uniref:aldehyde dehydrogenase family protein n=1 Tax=Streptomyces sp. NPDC126499 TaxID=3155314 RepID=UPI00331C6758